MAELPRISIVTPSFNSVATIAGTIQSVLSQDYANWEHIVVDGGSPDGTVAVLKRHPRLIWVSEKDEGHYHAMNKGIARAAGDIVVILNADDCFRPGALRKVAAAFQNNPAWDALAAERLNYAGYNTSLAPADKQTYASSLLYDLSATPDLTRATSLLTVLGLPPSAFVTAPTKSNTNYVLVVGADYKPCFNPNGLAP